MVRIGHGGTIAAAVLCLVLAAMPGHGAPDKLRRPAPSVAGVSSGVPTEKHIHGADDRIDLYQETDPLLRQWAASTCALVMSFRVRDNGNGTFSLSTSAWREDGLPPCAEEPFANQPFGAICTSFLIAPDLIATAGHCLTAQDLFGPGQLDVWMRCVFGFAMADATTPVTTFDASQVYTPVEIVGWSYTTTHDYALIRLDRPVTAPGAAPLPIRTSGEVAAGTPIGTIGHPNGLPMKLAFGPDAIVLDSHAADAFVSNLDIFQGNSGGPVFNRDTGVVEGIISRVTAEPQFVTQGGCFVSAVLPIDEEGQDAVRTTFLPDPGGSPPPNDACADAIPIAFGETYQGTTFHATADGAGSCVSDSGPDVWHRFTPSATQDVLLSTSGSTFDTTLAVFDTCGGAELACNDDAGNQRAKIRLTATAGQTYLIRVAGYDGQSGQYSLRIGAPPPSALRFLGGAQNDVEGTEGLDGAIDLALSPDGAQLYVSGTSSVVVFSRDVITSELHFLEAHYDGKNGAYGLDGGCGIALAPDGRHVYVCGEWADAVAVFARDAATGRLAFVEAVQDGVLDSATDVVVSPDNAFVYVASKLADTAAVFARDLATGKLTLVEAHRDGQSGVDGLNGARALAMSPDGAHLYVASWIDDAVAVFARNAATGRLTFVEALSDGFDAPTGIAVSPNGAQVYIVAHNDGTLSVFERNAATGTLTLVETYRADTIEQLAGARDVAVARDGAHVYVTSDSQGALVTFERDLATGAITYRGSEINNLGEIYGLFNAFGIATAPQSAQLYIASTDGTVAAYAHQNEVRITARPAPPFLAAGDRLELAVQGGPFTAFQWYKDDQPLEDDPGRVAGVTAPTLVFTPVQLDDAGTYHLVYDDRTKTYQRTQPYFLEVQPPGSVPAAGGVGILFLVGILALGGAASLKRRQ